MTKVFRLQEAYAPLLIDEKQPWQHAIDVLHYHTCVMHVRCTVAGPLNARVRLQQSARLEDIWFFEMSPAITFPVDAVGSVAHIIVEPQRYIRWRYLASAVGAQFVIDVVAREV